MKHLSLAPLLVLALSQPAFSAPPIVRATTALPDSPDAPKTMLDVAVTEATTAADLESAVSWAEKDLTQAQASNPSVKPQIVTAAPGPDGEPDAQPAGKRTLRQVATELFAKHYRVSFAVIRGIANASVVTWGIILSAHVALAAALPVGIVAGSMSAGLQFFNQRYNAWLLKSKTVPGQLSRNAVSNVIYMAVTKFLSAVTKVPQENTLAAAAGAVLKSSVMGTLAQGTWSLAFAKLEKLELAQHPEREGRIHKMTDLKALVNSMISTAITVANMMGAPLTDAAMLVMTGAGTAYYGWVALKERRWIRRKAEQDQLACEYNLVR